MAPSILLIGSTGNTGVGATRAVSDLAPKSSKFSKHRIIALTRDASSSSARSLAALPGVEVIAKDWATIDVAWLEQHEVERAFIAAANPPAHFAMESLFLDNARRAGVQYVVRISTTKANVGPTTAVSYARAHWAIETLLEQPEFNSLAWTSLQPNVFQSMYAMQAVSWVKTYREQGTKSTLRTIADEHAKAGVVDSNEVGTVAGTLLMLDDYAPHSKKKYVVSAPDDITGREFIDIVEKEAGTTVDDVSFRDMSFLFDAPDDGTAWVRPSTAKAAETGWAGETSAEVEPTSAELAEVYMPRTSAKEGIAAALAEACR